MFTGIRRPQGQTWRQETAMADRSIPIRLIPEYILEPFRPAIHRTRQRRPLDQARPPLG